MGYHGLNPLWKTDENLQGNKRPRAVPKDYCRLVCHMLAMLNQTPDIIGIGGEPACVVLRPVKFALRKPTTVVGHHLILRDQVGNQRVKGYSRAAGPWDQDEQWPGAALFIM